MWKAAPSPGANFSSGEPSPGTNFSRGEPSPGADVAAVSPAVPHAHAGQRVRRLRRCIGWAAQSGRTAAAANRRTGLPQHNDAPRAVRHNDAPRAVRRTGDTWPNGSDGRGAPARGSVRQQQPISAAVAHTIRRRAEPPSTLWYPGTWYLPRLWEERRRELDDQHERTAREDRGEDRMRDPCGCAVPPDRHGAGRGRGMGNGAGGRRQRARQQPGPRA